ncbi:MAG: arginine--tRNA ligase [Flavobacteriales bacterium]|uniref:arginine--tRNA ligase n=1 Tax=Blattabacterium sp. (Mastotermes darwiniensis) TaxID=39768 RepID=UPI000231DDBC|nr:arginine--tRNA ligase [Blattabacterium sp. (Mastotermes darwiniensis)]AER40496.1 arginyl-tRNA synthetase [Blattabacterium sp. (Mastotermes darwiniensis) str. MADAR]MDR1804989.1 arginine--tRNA ligase [Flavobacteriales bacterium]
MKGKFQYIEKVTKQSLSILYKLDSCPKLDFQYTKKEYPGDITLILFSLSKKLKQPVEKIGNSIGNYVQNQLGGLISFSIIGGFLNFIFKDGYYIHLLKRMLNNNFYYNLKSSSENIMIEYSSPNANKPLHLGHIRNSLIGFSISEILKMIGHKITKVQIINDRGIHICKSMIAWKKLGEGKTPDSTGMKGDHFVGRYYSLFDKIYHNQYKKNSKPKKIVPILKEARNLLKKWESGDIETMNIWKKMNKWVYDGFKKTYKKLGITFDKVEYESNVYEIGKNIVINGLEKGIFFKKEDGSIWVNLEKEGFDEKLLLRSDETSVYITQDIGTAVERFRKYSIDQLIYIVGEEQDYHFKVLFRILKHLGYVWVKKLSHLSYGMVDLPSGKMESRKGNIIDADSYILEIISMAKKKLSNNFSNKKKEKYAEVIGLGALKYNFLQVDPKKRIIFHPEKSMDFSGKTGTYIQYAYSRIRSLERKFLDLCSLTNEDWSNAKLDVYEKNMIKIIQKYPLILKKSAMDLNPSLVANYVYDVAKIFNHLYQNKKLIDPLDILHSNIRMNIIHVTGNILKSGMSLLGIKMLDHM